MSVARSSADDTLCSSGIVDDVMFSSDVSDLSVDVMFGRVRQVAAPVGGRAALLVTGEGAKSALLDCLVFHFRCSRLDETKTALGQYV